MLLLVLFWLLYWGESSFPTVVTTTCGQVQGAHLKEKNFVQFLGIPFSVPPLGTLRWQPPQKLVPSPKFAGRCWPAQIYNATYAREPCVQPPGSGSEDCLYLEVYVPSSASETSSLPVFFWIHGGGSIAGQGSFDPNGYGSPRTFAGKNNVVVVSVEYRMGIFGFLALEELNGIDLRKKNVSGNYGILDLLMALEWVQDEIGHFGGNPENVTIFGQSAGGVLVLALSVSAPAISSPRPLFRNVISMSGPPRLYHPLKLGAAMNYEYFVKVTSCANVGRGKALLDCLFRLSAKDLITAFNSTVYLPMSIFGLPIPPKFEIAPLEVVDGVTIPYSLEEAFGRGHFVRGEENGRTKYVFGMMREEPDMTPYEDLMNYTLAKYNAFIGGRFDQFYPELGEIALNLYPLDAFESPQQGYDQIVADIRVLCGNLALARAASLWAKQDVYAYICPQKPTPFPDPAVQWKDYVCRYAFHGYDAVAAFQNSLMFPQIMKQRDYEFGNYVREQLLTLDSWEPFGIEERVHLLEWKEGKTEEEYVVNPRFEKCAMWEMAKLVPEYSWIN